MGNSPIVGPTLTEMLEQTWMADGACSKVEFKELFWPPTDADRRPGEKANGRRLEKIRRERAIAAKEVCAGCPVRLECYAYAMRFPGLDGIWGGTTKWERKNQKSLRLLTRDRPNLQAQTSESSLSTPVPETSETSPKDMSA